MQTVELIDDNNNVMEYKGVRRYKLKDNLIYIDELIMSNDGIKEMISRGKTTKEISKIFNRKEEEIEKLAGGSSV